MNGYIDWSSRECDASCASQVIQSSQEVAQYAQMATAETAAATIALEETMVMIDDITGLSESIEGQIISLRNDIFELSVNITILRSEVEASMFPTLDDNIFGVIISVITGITICIVVCQLIIFNTSRMEFKREERKWNIMNKGRNRVRNNTG